MSGRTSSNCSIERTLIRFMSQKIHTIITGWHFMVIHFWKKEDMQSCTYMAEVTTHGVYITKMLLYVQYKYSLCSINKHIKVLIIRIIWQAHPNASLAKD